MTSMTNERGFAGRPGDLLPDIREAAGFMRAAQGIMPALRRHARRLAAGTADGDDLVQDTMIRAWSARHRFEEGSNFRAWVFRILNNVFLSRRRRSRRIVAWDERFDLALPDHADQETALHLADLGRALDAIPKPHAEALLAVTRDGLSYDDAAARFGVPSGTLRSRVSRARRAVVDRLDHGWAESRDLPPVVTPADPGEGDAYARWKRGGSGVIG